MNGMQRGWPRGRLRFLMPPLERAVDHLADLIGCVVGLAWLLAYGVAGRLDELRDEGDERLRPRTGMAPVFLIQVRQLAQHIVGRAVVGSLCWAGQRVGLLAEPQEAILIPGVGPVSVPRLAPCL